MLNFSGGDCYEGLELYLFNQYTNILHYALHFIFVCFSNYIFAEGAKMYKKWRLSLKGMGARCGLTPVFLSISARNPALLNSARDPK